MSTKVIDFDAFRAEQKQEPVSLKLGGKEYALPASLPAALALDLIRMNATDADREPNMDEIERMGAELFGGTAVFHEVLREGGVTMDEMPELIKMVLNQYAGVTPPNRGARRKRAKTTSASSGTGRSSSRTSDASTSST